MKNKRTKRRKIKMLAQMLKLRGKKSRRHMIQEAQVTAG